MRPAASFARPICSHSARSSSSSFAAAGALIALPNSRPGATFTAPFASARLSWLPSAPRSSARATSWPANTGCRSQCSPIPATPWPSNSVSSTPSLSTTATTTSRFSSTFHSSTASKVGGCPFPPHTSSTATAASYLPKPTPTSASAPSRKKRWPPHSRPTTANSQFAVILSEGRRSGNWRYTVGDERARQIADSHGGHHVGTYNLLEQAHWPVLRRHYSIPGHSQASHRVLNDWLLQ